MTTTTTTVQLSDTARAVLTYAIQNHDTTGGLVEWFPDSVKGGARAAVIKGLRAKGLIGDDDVITLAAYAAVGMEAPAAPVVVDAPTPSPADAQDDAAPADVDVPPVVEALPIDADTTEAAAMVEALDAPDDGALDVDGDATQDDGAQDGTPSTTTPTDDAQPTTTPTDAQDGTPTDESDDDGTCPEVQAALEFLGFMDDARKWFKRSRGVPPAAIIATLDRMRAAMAGAAVRASRATTTTTTPRAARAPRPEGAAPTPREDTKQARMIAMMRRPAGASMAEICAELGMIPHTARGIISGTLRGKLRLTVMCAGGVYRIPTDGATPPAATPTPAPAAPADAQAPADVELPTTPRPVLAPAAWMPAGLVAAIAAAGEGADDTDDGADDIAA